ncbi:MAG TPA: hypothetical protein VEI02_01825, partial [Planctomycetota bacterium]|nr:hypothetical protein [Planctomycetota bacterium]
MAVQLVYDDGEPLAGAEVRLVRSAAALRLDAAARRRRSAHGEPATLDHHGRAVVALDGDEPFKLDVRLPDSWGSFQTPPMSTSGG